MAAPFPPVPAPITEGTLPAFPCAWEINPTLCGDPEVWAGYTAAVQDAAIAYASLTLWAATGRRFGLCETIIRPCGEQCGQNNWNGGYWWSQGTWFPYMFDGQWLNAWSGDPFACLPAHQVWLPGPVAWVVQVTVDGAVVPDTSWRVDDRTWLVRTDGTGWPRLQDYNVDSGVGVFDVTYLRGIAVPIPLLNAAGTLAAEYAKACVGGVCQLPARVTQVVRSGVSITAVNPDKMLARGLTGIFSVDQVITALNPYALKAPMQIISPDQPVSRMVTQA